MKSELDPGSVWQLTPASSVGAEGGMDLLTRTAVSSPEQLLSPSPFTSSYDAPAAWLVFRGDCAVKIQDGRCFPLCLIEERQL